MLKKTSLTLLGLLCSSLGFAGSMGPVCAPGNVTVPCQADKWDLGVQALYLRPLYSRDMAYTPVGSNIFLNEPQPDWHWGYRIEGSWHFNAGSDITLNWSHYDADNYAGTFPGFYSLGSLSVATPYDLNLDNQYDQVNLVLGQLGDASVKSSAHFYGGLQYANIRVDRTHNYVVSPALAGLVGGAVYDLNNSDFKGVGPVAGIDYAYGISRSLSVTANTAASILYGTSRLNFATAYGNGFVPVAVYNSRKMIVPSFEAKLGANYAHYMGNGRINLEGGYQVVNYFNALPSRNLSGAVSHNNNFGMYGPYVGLKWLGSV